MATQPMKILHLISGGDVGGAKTHVLSLLHGLSAHVAVHLVVFRDGLFADEARALGIPLTVLPGSLRTSLDTLTRLVRDEGYTILHSHGSRGNLAVGLLRRRAGVPIVTTVHSDYRHDYLGRPLARLTYGNLNKWALRRMDHYIGVSQVMTDLLCNRGFPPDRILTLYNGLDFSTPPPSVDRTAFWQSHGFDLSPGDVVCGIAARLEPVKDVDTLLRAFAAVARECPNFKLAIAGDGLLRDRLTERAEALSIGDRVFFAGWMSDMDAFYQAIDINLLTSLTENFPYALIEGARSKLPTIATAVGGVPALIDRHVSGFLFTPGDDAALAGYLGQLYGDENLRATMGQRLYDKAAACFSLEAMLQTQLDIYHIITRRASRKPVRRSGVMVCGSYGRGNAGDDAILEGILREIRAVDPDRKITVLSRNPRQTRRTCGVQSTHMFNPFGFLRAARRAEVFISGGGNLIQNVTSSRSLWYYIGAIALARLAGARVLMYGCGVGPLSGRLNRRLTAAILNRAVEAITLREDSSLRDLERLNITKPRVVLSADPALILSPSPPERIDSLLLSQNVPPDGAYIAFVLRHWPGFRERAAIFAQAADYARETYGVLPLFLPIERRGDVEAARMTAELVQGSCHLVGCPDGPADVIGLLGRCRMVVAMRLHALIFASGQGLPLVGVAYDDKVSAFLRYMGQETYLPFDSLNASELCQMIDAAMAHAGSPDDRLTAVGHLRDIESRNVEILEEMLR